MSFRLQNRSISRVRCSAFLLRRKAKHGSLFTLIGGGKNLLSEGCFFVAVHTTSAGPHLLRVEDAEDTFVRNDVGKGTTGGQDQDYR